MSHIIATGSRPKQHRTPLTLLVRSGPCSKCLFSESPSNCAERSNTTPTFGLGCAEVCFCEVLVAKLSALWSLFRHFGLFSLVLFWERFLLSLLRASGEKTGLFAWSDSSLMKRTYSLNDTLVGDCAGFVCVMVPLDSGIRR